MDDLELECEDVLHGLCDARQKFPQKCARELEKCIRHTSKICMTPCLTKNIAASVSAITPFTPEQNKFLEAGLANKNALSVFPNEKVQMMLEQIDNLRTVMEHVKREKTDTTFTYV